jgi:phosphoglucomutase
MSLSVEIENLVAQWLQWDKNSETRKEIETLYQSKNESELTKRLLKRIAFGTAGLRGKMQAGFSCMNDLTIIQASQVCLHFFFYLK